jgi:UDPglucose 6-dehydrogenase
MKVTVIGTGYVGLVTGTCLSELGNDVVCLDKAAEKIRSLQNGIVPIYEPGLSDMIVRNAQADRLRFTTDPNMAIAHGDIIFIAVGTPPDEDGSADLRHVLEVAHTIGQLMDKNKIVVNKSTVPVGTAEKVSDVLQSALTKRDLSQSLQFSVVSNPEFLKEGAAVEDFMRPDRIVLGLSACEAGQHALLAMRSLYAPFNRHHERTLVMSNRAAELTKYAANAMLATRISFMNEMANLAEDLGVDIDAVRQGIGSDPRIGYSFLYAGTGYGGSCFPKDVQALCHMAQQQGSQLQILNAVEITNRQQKRRILEKIVQRFGEDLRGKHFAVWGLAFKPETDDMRDAPSRELITGLIRRGATVRAHDPIALETAQEALQDDLSDDPGLWSQLSFVDNPYDACEGADALVLMTEWKAFRSPDFAWLKENLLKPVLFDGRNLFDPQLLDELGFVYEGIGRRTSLAKRSENAGLQGSFHALIHN